MNCTRTLEKSFDCEEVCVRADERLRRVSWEVGFGGSLNVRRVLTARLFGSTTLESFSEVIGRGVPIILRTERQRRSI